MQLIKDVPYGAHKAQLADLYLPEKADAVFVYFHGGGLNRGDKDGSSYFAPYLAERGIAVVTANYRMYPDAKYPDFIEDAATCVAWAYGYMRENLGCERMYVGGSSAGGYLSMMLCFDRRYLTAAGVDPSVVSGYFHDAGQPTAHFSVLKYDRGVSSKRVIIDETAPLFYVGMAERYSPMLIIYSDNDMVNRPQQTEVLITTLKHFKYDMSKVSVIRKNGTHCAYVDRIDEAGESEFAKMIAPFILGE